MANPPEVIDKSKLVHGDPTKDFFITMLIKDITLRDAIGDLVDNSVDAIKAKATNRENLKGYTINIKVDGKRFSISDNGTGIEEEIAREYAFKLGKPKDHKLIDHSIGRFGIGMKRAFFKLGNSISVKSKAPTSSFSISIPVSTWKEDEDNWDFHFENVKAKQKNAASITGTTIEITDLSADAKENFKKPQFEYELREEIATEQILNINKGIIIKINNEPIAPPDLTLKFNKEIIPAYWKHTFKHSKDSELHVEIFAGVSDEVEIEGGWNIFCNDRLILSRDTSATTGWTGTGGDGVAKYHQQFWGFRGYVFFNSKKSSSLPWNTTKTGIDPDSSDYLAVRKKMIELMKDVFLLLNRQKKEREKDNPVKNQTLNNKVYAAKAVSVIKIVKEKNKLDPKFHFPADMNAIRETDQKTIRYTVPTVKFNKVKKHIGASNPSDVGSLTFDHYYENEIGD
jgi:hypothetical protein